MAIGIMNTTDAAVDACASCGIEECDDVHLKKCNACKLVRYCSVSCQKDHRPKHKRECKRRAAELREDLLFRQPESTDCGDCPICLLPMPLDPTKTSHNECCSKTTCNRCSYANEVRQREEALEHRCPFCRSLTPTTDAEGDAEGQQYLQKRMEANEPEAFVQSGIQEYATQNYNKAFEHFTKAAELSHIMAHSELALLYLEGNGVGKDEKKWVYHLEQAAIGGNVNARYNLGCVEGRKGNHKRAMKHFIIAATLGDDKSIASLKQSFRIGLVTKEDLAAAFRAHKAAVDATKSPQRKEAEEVGWDDLANSRR